MDPVSRIVEQAKKSPRTIVLPEGNDPRTWQAARRLLDEKIATPAVLGTPAEIEEGKKASGVSGDGPRGGAYDVPRQSWPLG